MIDDDRVGGRPSVCGVLGIRQRHEVELATALASHHDIMRRDAGLAAELVFIDAVIDADKFDIGLFQTAASEFVVRDTIDSVAEQVGAIAIRDDQVNRNARGCIDGAQERVRRNHADRLLEVCRSARASCRARMQLSHRQDVRALSMHDRWMSVCMYFIMAGRDDARRPKHRSNPPIAPESLNLRRNASREAHARASIQFHSAMIVVEAAISFRNSRFDVSLWSGLSRRHFHPGFLLGILPARGRLARRPFYSSRVERHVR
ncbi:hypothetical protein [Burkholderia sp. A9]|uniref:hypothetical protein n=1 Tax=Burkholderia sp. A9 TaxID=1365108 RepID=UPI001379263C|nr:hypothetical protein [Burkholderia sp. A9]